MSQANALLVAAIRERHADRQKWLTENGARGMLHEVHEDVQTLLDIIDPPSEPKKLLKKPVQPVAPTAKPFAKFKLKKPV